MALPTLNLSLQFGDIPYAARHRTALPRHKVVSWIRHSLSHDAEITVRIVGTEEGHRLNREFRKKDYATNVLTFDYMQSPVVAKEAREQGKTLQAHYAHLLVHGTLHSQGWDHETSEADAEAMEAHEIEIMHRLGFKSPY